MPQCTVFTAAVACPYTLQRLALTCRMHTDYYTHVQKHRNTHVYRQHRHMHALWQNIQPLTLSNTHTRSQNGVHYHMWLPVRRGVGGRGWLVCACVTGGPHLSTALHRRGGDAIWQPGCNGGCVCLCVPWPFGWVTVVPPLPCSPEDPLVSDWWFRCVSAYVCVFFFGCVFRTY